MLNSTVIIFKLKINNLGQSKQRSAITHQTSRRRMERAHRSFVTDGRTHKSASKSLHIFQSAFKGHHRRPLCNPDIGRRVNAKHSRTATRHSNLQIQQTHDTRQIYERSSLATTIANTHPAKTKHNNIRGRLPQVWSFDRYLTGRLQGQFRKTLLHNAPDTHTRDYSRVLMW